MTKNDALEEAKKRMEEGRVAREQHRNGDGCAKEPDNLVSGNFDEVELKRIEKYGEQDE